jgi:hypothetical protein
VAMLLLSYGGKNDKKTENPNHLSELLEMRKSIFPA